MKTHIIVRLPIVVIIMALVLLEGCSPACIQGKIDADPTTVNRALCTVAKKNNWYFQRSNDNSATTSNYYVPPNADLIIVKSNTNSHNKTGFFSAVRLDTSDDSTKTNYKIVLETVGGDKEADARLVMEFARQQILLDRGEIPKTINPLKPKGHFLALNFLSPIVSAHYLMKDNPLITPYTKKYMYMQNGLGDAVMVSSLIGAAFTKNNKERSGLLVFGLAYGILCRLITLQNLTDLKDYNNIAKLDYDIKMATDRLNADFR